MKSGGQVMMTVLSAIIVPSTYLVFKTTDILSIDFRFSWGRLCVDGPILYGTGLQMYILLIDRFRWRTFGSGFSS